VPRVDFECFREISKRPIVVTLSLVSDAAVNVSGAVPRVNLDRPRIIRDRAIVVALGLEGNTAV